MNSFTRAAIPQSHTGTDMKTIHEALSDAADVITTSIDVYRCQIRGNCTVDEAITAFVNQRVTSFVVVNRRKVRLMLPHAPLCFG